jgi:hypothetical protein
VTILRLRTLEEHPTEQLKNPLANEWTDLFPSVVRRSRKLLALFLHRIYLKAFAKNTVLREVPCIYEISRVVSYLVRKLSYQKRVNQSYYADKCAGR